MVAATLTPERAIRQPRRIDGRALVGLFLLFAAIAGAILFWQSVNDTRGVVIATRDLPAGATLSASDLAVARLRADDAVYAAAVPADGLSGLVGRQLAEPVHAQQLLVTAQIAAKPRLGPDQLVLTVPASPTTAAGGRVRPGDEVVVIASFDKGKATARTEVVIPRASVYDVGEDRPLTVVNTGGSDAAARAGSGSIGWISLIVDRPQAVRLSDARVNAELSIGLLPPAPAGSGR